MSDGAKYVCITYLGEGKYSFSRIPPGRDKGNTVVAACHTSLKLGKIYTGHIQGDQPSAYLFVPSPGIS